MAALSCTGASHAFRPSMSPSSGGGGGGSSKQKQNDKPNSKSIFQEKLAAAAGDFEGARVYES